MSWLCVGEDGTEEIFQEKPIRWDGWMMDGKYVSGHWNYWHYSNYSDKEIEEKNCNYVVVPKGSIAKLIGRNISWTDEPVEYN